MRIGIGLLVGALGLAMAVPGWAEEPPPTGPNCFKSCPEHCCVASGEDGPCPDGCPVACCMAGAYGGRGDLPVQPAKGYSGQGVAEDPAVRAEVLATVRNLRQAREGLRHQQRVGGIPQDALAALQSQAMVLSEQVRPAPLDDLAVRTGLMELEALIALLASQRRFDLALPLADRQVSIYLSMMAAFPDNPLLVAQKRAAWDRRNRLEVEMQAASGSPTGGP